jgi:hypothetical protein
MTNRERFRVQFWPTYCLILLWSLGILILLIAVIDGTEMEIERLPPTALAMAFLALLGTAAIWANPVCLSPTEIRSANFWGINRSVRWSDVERVSVLNLGLRFLIVKSTGGTRLLIPTFLALPLAFQERVQSLGGADHPLSRAVRTQMKQRNIVATADDPPSP